MKNVLFVLMIALGLQAQAQAHTQAQVELTEVTPSWKTGWYEAGSTLTHRFDQPTYVERLLISAEGYRNFAKAYVYADGDLISVLGVPGTDPDYPVIIRKTVSSIVMKFEGSVRITDFRLYIGGSAQDSFNRYNLANLETPAQLGKAVIKVVAELQEIVSDKEFKQYLLPLRQSALMLSAKGMGRPLLSDNTQHQARVMISQLKRADAFLLGRLANSDFYSDQVQTLLYVKEKLESIYDIR